MAAAASRFDVVVIGAGAAGMMCAAQAGMRGRKVLLVDHATRLGEKIRISGGGRCNFTNRRVAPDNYLSQNPHFTRSALSRYGPADFIALVDRYRIAWHERSHGQLFCDDSAQAIIDMLRGECADGGVEWATPVEIRAVRKIAGDAGVYEVVTSAGTYSCASLVVATGGLAIPGIGATPFGYRIAEQFGVPVVPPRPALVPLTLPPETLERLKPLAGASLEVEASSNGRSFREALLITHRGLSGPVVLQVSSYWQAQAWRDGEWDPVHIDLLPGCDVAAWLAGHAADRALLANLLAERLPRRFAHAWCALHGWERPLNQFRPAEIKHIAATLTDWCIVPSGTQGYAKAEVTLGGVDTRALSSKTMEATRCKGLYFIGEVVDVTGHLGGYNFQWAWSSGFAAAQFV
ncbi:MAG: NAD(P)/FAD-dependent oxidoreductase [Rhodocyclales bacterium]|nr:NAD(P)/FAD-dependent oxidoreductase [Rhodocyclales bacterium]